MTNIEFVSRVRELEDHLAEWGFDLFEVRDSTPEPYHLYASYLGVKIMIFEGYWVVASETGHTPGYRSETLDNMVEEILEQALSRVDLTTVVKQHLAMFRDTLLKDLYVDTLKAEIVPLPGNQGYIAAMKPNMAHGKPDNYDPPRVYKKGGKEIPLTLSRHHHGSLPMRMTMVKTVEYVLITCYPPWVEVEGLSLNP